MICNTAALTSAIMKSLEKNMVQHLNSEIGHSENSFLFAYGQGRSSEDTIINLVLLITKHIHKPNLVYPNPYSLLTNRIQVVKVNELMVMHLKAVFPHLCCSLYILQTAPPVCVTSI